MACGRIHGPEITGTFQAFLSQIGGSYIKLCLRDAITTMREVLIGRYNMGHLVSTHSITVRTK